MPLSAFLVTQATTVVSLGSQQLVLAALLASTASLEPKQPLLLRELLVGLVLLVSTALQALPSLSPAQTVPGLPPQLKAPAQPVQPVNPAAGDSSSVAIITGTALSQRTPLIHTVDSVQQVPIYSLMQEVQPLHLAVLPAPLESTAALVEWLVTVLRVTSAAPLLLRQRQQELLEAQPTHAQSATTALRARRVRRGVRVVYTPTTQALDRRRSARPAKEATGANRGRKRLRYVLQATTVRLDLRVQLLALSIDTIHRRAEQTEMTVALA